MKQLLKSRADLEKLRRELTEHGIVTGTPDRYPAVAVAQGESHGDYIFLKFVYVEDFDTTPLPARQTS
jgi:hypothetical protein